MSSSADLRCFKTYDVRGKLGEELDEHIAYRIGRAVVQSLDTKSVVVGFDARETSPKLAQSVVAGICDSGCDAIEIGLSGTEEVYSAVAQFDADAGIEITASHNPINYNGMKIVKYGANPLSQYEFLNIKNLAGKKKFPENKKTGLKFNKKTQARSTYLDKIMSFVDIENLKPLKIVINSGNGAAGPVIDALKIKLEDRGAKTDFVLVNHNPDPAFPNGIPNPLIEENRISTANVVSREKADFGVAFDGDFDRCFLFDHLGNFISGEYIIGLLAEIFLSKEICARIIHDPRVVWNIQDIASKFSGQAIRSKTGHAFVKAAMRESEAVYGGEMSAHHYFKDFYYCDSGMIPWLMVWELLSQKGTPIADLISDQKNRFPSSGELNFRVHEPGNCMKKVKKVYVPQAKIIDEFDGLSMSFDRWRFNLRKSNTEPFVRLNVEAMGDELLMHEKTKELASLIVKS